MNSPEDEKTAFFNRDRVVGFIIYPSGDLIAQLILGQFNILRILMLSLTGGLVYAFEIPRWFGWIQRKTDIPWQRTVAAIVYFNPLWIARHLFVIAAAISPLALSDGNAFLSLTWHCILTGTKSFAGGIALGIIANFLIQNRLPLKHRFLGSSIFSGIMAIYYALAQAFFQ